MSYRIDDPTGRVVAEWRGSCEPPRFAVGDLVVEIVSNELYQVADRYCDQVDMVDIWIYVCQKMKIDDEAGRILRTTRCDADLEEIPDFELQPLPPRYEITAPRSQIAEPIPPVDLVGVPPSAPSVQIPPTKSQAPMIELQGRRLLPEKGGGS
jgi:hypothetical protein